MSKPIPLVRFLRSLLRRRRLERDLDEELSFHLERQIEANIRQGMEPEEARHEALRLFGGVDQIKESCREVRGTRYAEEFGRDIRHSFRVFRKSPGFAAAAVFTLALGIGATTAVFSVVNGVLLQPLPFPDPSTIMTLWNCYPEQGVDQEEVSPPDWWDWCDQNQSFAQLAAYERYFWTLDGDPYPVRLQAARVSGDFFAALGIGPILGRPILPDDDHEGVHHVVVLSHGLWVRQFGADPGIIGQTVGLTGVAYKVVGVMPDGFGFPEGAELWTPLAYEPPFDPTLRRYVWLRTVARLRQGITPAQARLDLSEVAHRLEERHPDTNRGRDVSVVSLYEQTVGEVRPALLVLLAAVGFLLLIACANVANLQLARSAGRQQEFGLRAALGAGWKRLARQLVTESTMLGLLGGGGGVLLAWLSLQLLRLLGPQGIPRLQEVGLDTGVLLFAAATALAAGVLSGLAPALLAGRTDLFKVLREGDQRVVDSPRRRRLRATLIVVELALAEVLLVGGCLLVQSFIHLSRVDAGFEPDDVLTGRFEVQSQRYDQPGARQGFYRQAVEHMAALPGVQSAALATTIPLHETQMSLEFVIQGRPEPTQLPSAGYNSITPGYFGTMGVRLVAGRYFTDADGPYAPAVVMVNRTMADRFWPDASPVGEQLRLVDESDPREIVGVVEDVRQMALGSAPRAEIYIPYAQKPWSSGFLIVRAAGEPTDLVGPLRRAFREIDPTLALSEFRTMRAQISASLGSPRFSTVLLGVFASLALVLAIVGVFSVVSFATSQRTRDFAIRRALGAERHDILGVVVGQGIRSALTGVGLGLGLSIVLTRFLTTLLFGVTAMDPLTHAAVAGVLSVVALVACVIPSRLAMRVDPAVALRQN